jgi:hypothetical protein
VPLEQEAVRTYGEMSAAVSKLVLPILEYVLRERLIPEFQRAVVQNLPVLAQQTTGEVARRHGQRQQQRPQTAVLWRMQVRPVGYPDERDPLTRTLPAIDPAPGGAGGYRDPVPDPTPDSLAGADYAALSNPQQYLDIAIQQRDRLSKVYLEQWIADRMRFFEYEAKMSQYSNLFRVFTGVNAPPRSNCGHLGKLLYEEYPNSNLPHVIRMTESGIEPNALRDMEDQAAINQYLDRNFMFLGVAYRQQFAETFAGFFRSALASDPLTFAQVHLFIPRPRWRYITSNSTGQSGVGGPGNNGGGGFGIDVPVPTPSDPNFGAGGAGNGSNANNWIVENWPRNWNLLNQNWTVQLVPAIGNPWSGDNLAALLQTRPPDGAAAQPIVVTLPNLGGANSKSIRQISGH